jgi:hypothetical protein
MLPNVQQHIQPNPNNNNNNGNGRRRNQNNNQGGNIVQQVPPRDNLRKPHLNFGNGVLSAFHAKYSFGKEGTEIMQTYFKNLYKAPPQKNKEGAETLRFTTGLGNHPHPVGATFRAHFHDLILHQFAPQAKMLDIGSSIQRMVSRFDPPVNGVEQPVTNRVHMTAPYLSLRDCTRRVEKLSVPEVMNCPHVCHCVGGTQSCPNCAVAQNFHITTAIDSIYYPGVLEEMAKHTHVIGSGTNYKSVAHGYVAFNDYHAAFSQNRVLRGECADGESEWEIRTVMKADGMPPTVQVASTVRGNIAPYTHRVINSRGLHSWANRFEVDAHPNLPNMKLQKIAVFEVIDEVWNKSVPYRLCKVFIFDYADWEKEPMYGVRVLGRWMSYSEIEDFSEITAKIPGEDDPYANIKTDFIMNNNMRDRREADINTIISNFSRNTVKEGESLKIWDSLCYEMANVWSDYRTNERIFTSVENDALWITAEVYKTYLGISFRKYEHTMKAPLKLVIEAYVALGNKKTIDSLQNACANTQKDSAAIFGDGVIHAHEAFLIARIIRGQQAKRTEKIFSMATSLKTTN